MTSPSETVVAPALVPYPAEPLSGVEAVERHVAAVNAGIADAQQHAAKNLRDGPRAAVEKGLLDARAQFARAKSAAEEAGAAVEASYGATQKGVIAFNVKAIEAIQASAHANFDLMKSLFGAKTLSELVTLNTEFARKRFEDVSARGKELALLAREVADEAAAPIKAHVGKSFNAAA